MRAKFWLASVLFSFVTALFAISSPATAAETLKIVENEKVCMVTDMHFGKKQIPVTVSEKTYYGCCQNCKATLTNDAKARTAIDPVSGKSVDKAKAVIAALDDNSVLYFENKKNFEEYSKTMSSFKNGKPSSGGHSHH